MNSDSISNFINISIVLCSFVESYIFPFAILKWVFVLSKFGRYSNFIKRSTNKKEYYSYVKNTDTCLVPLNECSKYESHLNIVSETHNNVTWMQLSYCGLENCNKIPPALGKMYGAKTHYLDLSYNGIETLKGLEQFQRLEELILDNNKLPDGINYPYLPNLRTLSVNNNQITDLEQFIQKICVSFPALTYLSLLCNRACPNQLSDLEKDDSDYQRYRYYVIYKLPSLRFLDSRRIWSAERCEGLRRGQYALVRRPDPLRSPPPPAPLPAATKPPPINFNALGKHKGAYGKIHYTYTGKHSEGNRFIVNSDL